MKNRFRRLIAALTALLLALSLSGAAAAETADKAVNIAVTGTIGPLNPLLMDNTEVVKYATSLSFLSLVELNRELEFVGQLAEEITTEDNRTFTVKLDPEANWSDGEPVTAKDVLFTLLCWASPENGNTA
ncbi:MAG: ABC transporter substrate-binding protein [Candidatus Faecivicinus sp.]